MGFSIFTPITRRLLPELDKEPGPLADFTKNFLRCPITDWQIPEDGIRFFSNIVTTVLLKESPFQVELVQILPGPRDTVGLHRHPHINSYLIHVAGKSAFVSDENPKRVRRYLKIVKPSYVEPGHLVSVPSTHYHGVVPGPNGVIFLNFEQWEGEITSAAIDWEGEKIDSEHAELCSQSIN
jgi:hypothetical protein